MGAHMSLINPVGLHHLRIAVTDLARSRAFYQDVLGFAVVAESPGDPSDPQVRNDPAQLYGGVVLQIAGLLFGLRPVADPADRFVSKRVGLISPQPFRWLRSTNCPRRRSDCTRPVSNTAR